MTRKPDLGNSPVWVLPSICRLRRVRRAPLRRTSLIKCYWRETLLRENQQDGGGGEGRGGVKLSPPSANSDIRFKDIIIYICFQKLHKTFYWIKIYYRSAKMFLQTLIYVLIISLQITFGKIKFVTVKVLFFLSGVETFSAALNNQPVIYAISKITSRKKAQPILLLAFNSLQFYKQE